MLGLLSRWFQRRPAASAEAERALRDWAEPRGFTLRPVRDGAGVVIEGRSGNQAWRLEWGPSQRKYVQGGELRLRAELGLAPELQLLVLNRSLQQAIEREVFEQYVDGVKTQIDDQTPPEMRWLVMFPQLTAADLGVLRETFAAAGSLRPWLLSWLQGPLTQALAAALPAPEHPLVLMIGRGRLMLRTACSEPDENQLNSWMRLFDVAMREARRAQQQTLPQELPVSPTPGAAG